MTTKQRQSVALVTGATDGLGRGLARAFAQAGWNVLVHGRNAHRGRQVVDELTSLGAAASFYQADFASFDQVRSLADEICASYRRLDVLVNNAGLGIEDARQESRDGLEMLLQVDYLSPYLLTRRLLPLLSQSGPTRIVNVSSAGQSPLNFKDLMLEHSWSGQQSYCQAKLAQIMMTFDLAEEYSADQVTINALHPASMMPTKIVVGRFSPMSTLESGVENVFRLATDDRFLGVSGKYFNELREARANAQAYDAHTRAELKRVSEQLLGDWLD